MNSISKNDRSGHMFVYAWCDKGTPNVTKFGETFIKHDENPEEECKKRVYNDLTSDKHKFKDGTIEMVGHWDVGVYANKLGKNYTYGHIDDVIRNQLNFPLVDGSREKHTVSGEEFVAAMNDWMIQQNQPLPPVSLSTKQYESLHEVLLAIYSGKRTIAANLCARFGKTIWAGALIRELDKNVNVVCSYVLSSFTSFINDLRRFDQFRDFEMIDSSQNNWKDQFNLALKNNKKIVVFLSLCPGGNREERIEHIFSSEEDKLIIIDEVDFGAHKANQVEPLTKARSANDVVVLMTGTNIEKVVNGWQIDHIRSVTYPELLISKNNLFKANPSYYIKHFQEDINLNSRYVEMEVYQMPLVKLLEQVKKQDPDMFMEGGIFLPQWSKTVANPKRAKGLIVQLFQSLFQGKHNMDQLNVDFQTDPTTDFSVSMVFFPTTTTKNSLKELTRIIQEALPNFEIVNISGDSTTNKDAEPYVKQKIFKARKDNKSVILLSMGMASRSFSIPQIDKIFLAYDRGEAGPTIQKLSRALTPSDENKIAKIFSLSFDPNRDDKFDSVVVETAKNIKDRNGLTFPEALKLVLRTMNIFKCTEEGRIEFDPNDYLFEMLKDDRIDRTIVQQVSLQDAILINQLASGKSSNTNTGKQQVAPMGKTYKQSKNKNKVNMTREEETELKKAKEQIAKIIRRIDVIWKWPELKGTLDVEGAFAFFDQNTKLQKYISDFYEISYEIIKEVVCNLVDRDMLMVKLHRINS